MKRLLALILCAALAVPSLAPAAPTDCSDANSNVVACGTVPWARTSITTGATTTIKTGPGVLHGVTVNTLVASATITIYDNTAGSGTKIATITLPSTITAATPFEINYDVGFATGLTIVTSGATDITVASQ